MYLKRNSMNKFWPLPNKGTKYLAVANHNLKNSVPLIIVLRDILKLVKTKKELRKSLNEKKIMINSKVIKETNFPVQLFDIITLTDSKKYFKAELSDKKKIVLNEIKESKTKTKTYKVIGKKILRKGIVQLNLLYGKNILIKANEKIKSDDSIIINLKDNKVVKIIEMKKGTEGYVYDGKYASKSGVIEDIIERGGRKLARIKTKKEKINVWIKNVIAIK